MFDFRTDLANERRDIYKKANKLEDEIPGIEVEERSNGKYIKVTKVKITTDEGAKILGKLIGNYVTIDIKLFNVAGEAEIQTAAETMAEELKKLIGNFLPSKEDILVVGLGNAEVTPDALGSKVVSKIDVTRHWFTYMPEFTDEHTRPVSAIAPGVLGTTGIETLEILKGVVDNVRPKLLIVIDALASKSIERISSTIQISDTGIVPGAGVGNTRKELSQNTLGIPVIAVGVPTVVEAAVVAADGLDFFIDKMQQEGKSNDYLNQLKEEDKYQIMKEALLPGDYNFIVTPKEIDELIVNMTSVIARGINMSF